MIRRLLILIAAAAALTVSATGNNDWKELKSDINLFIANDLGRNGYYDQKQIASLMGEMAEAIGPEAVLALGDVHHFEGVASVSDPLWMTNYESIYSHPELMTEWLPILGNHEYRGNTGAVLDYSRVSRRWVMPARYYSRTFRDKDTSVKMVFIDTTPLIDKYRNEPDKYPDACRQDLNEQLSWLDNELQNGHEDWVIVVGHHPIYADTPKDDTERRDMERRVDTILRKHKVDMYICGHIHNFQHIRRPDSGTDYIVNSSGSLSRPKVKKTEGAVFVSGEAGFSVLGASKHTLTLSMINKNGTVIHQIERRE